MNSLDDTIAAIATAIVPDRGSVGIVRLSGSHALAIARQLFQTRAPWQSHHILYGKVYDPQTARTIDEGLVLFMQAPRSYTREDVIEFHCHGGIMVVQQVLQLCLQFGARLADPGEFTLRAFLNGRIDLAQAESIQDLVGAKSAHGAQLALAAMQGKLSGALRHLQAQCLDWLTEIEARLDFEEDLPPLDIAKLTADIAQISDKAQEYLASRDRGELIRSGLKVAIVGRPNVGKSSLLNAWSRTDRAIVTELPGTTRDVVDSHLVVQGIPITVLDTAGIRDTTDRVEQIGVARSRQVAQEADLVLLVIDAQVGWLPEDEIIWQLISDRSVILVINKIDLQPWENLDFCYPGQFIQVVTTAAAHQQGIDELERAIVHSVQSKIISAANLDFAVNQRQAACLQVVVASLTRVQETIENQLPLDFWTIDLRAALGAIGEITGDEVTESILGKVFSRFCIGK